VRKSKFNKILRKEFTVPLIVASLLTKPLKRNIGDNLPILYYSKTPLSPVSIFGTSKQIFHDNKSLFYSTIGNEYKFSLKRHMNSDLYYNDIFGAHCTL